MEKSIINNPPWCVAVHASIEFDTIERLCALGKTALDTELNELHKAMDEDYKTLEPGNEEGTYLAHVNDEYIEVSEILPCLHWYSQFLISYSFFERALNALSISFQKNDVLSLSLKDMSGQGITRARTYMMKVCNITKPFELPEWHTANLLAEIRNAIAHRNGYIDYLPNDKGSLYFRLIDKGIELKNDCNNQEDAQIILTGDFVLNSIKVFRRIIEEIGGLEKDFVTPKHGLPSGLDSVRSW